MKLLTTDIELNGDSCDTAELHLFFLRFRSPYRDRFSLGVWVEKTIGILDVKV